MSQPKVLFLDDETDLLELFRDSCEDLAEVRVFADSEKAIESAIKVPPDIAFLDYRLPGMSATEVAGRFPRGVVLHLLTGELDLALPEGFASVLVKPVHVARLRELIQGKE